MASDKKSLLQLQKKQTFNMMKLLSIFQLGRRAFFVYCCMSPEPERGDIHNIAFRHSKYVHDKNRKWEKSHRSLGLHSTTVFASHLSIHRSWVHFCFMFKSRMVTFLKKQTKTTL